ncbi:MAG: hypothetical protein LBI03_10775, partial [Clostridiales bacterium]|nr:hypothetical protein [Clostridiales bacterium]
MFKIAPFKKDKMKPLYRVIMLLMAVVLVVSTLMTGTLAWSDFSQHKTNVATGGDQVRTVLLHKYEKD